MKIFAPSDKADQSLRTIARFARFCICYVDYLLRLEPMARLVGGYGDGCRQGQPKLIIITAITRITAIASMLMRYAEKPRPRRPYGHIRSGSPWAYRARVFHTPALPLGKDKYSLMVRKMGAAALMMIRRDQIQRFGVCRAPAHQSKDAHQLARFRLTKAKSPWGSQGPSTLRTHRNPVIEWGNFASVSPELITVSGFGAILCPCAQVPP